MQKAKLPFRFTPEAPANIGRRYVETDEIQRFIAEEDEMYDFGFDGLSSGRSPDRLDALGMARSGPRIRLLGGDHRLVPSWIFGRRD